MAEAGRAEGVGGGDGDPIDPRRHPIPPLGLQGVLDPTAARALMDEPFLVTVDAVQRGVDWAPFRVVRLLDPQGVGDEQAFSRAEGIDDLCQQPKDLGTGAFIFVAPGVAAFQTVAVPRLVESLGLGWEGIEHRYAEVPSARDLGLTVVVRREAKPARV